MDDLEKEHHVAGDLVQELMKIAAAYVQNPLVMRYRVVAILRQLVELYPAHIWKENYLLFPMAQGALSATEQKHLREKFETVEQEVGEDDQFVAVVKQLECPLS